MDGRRPEKPLKAESLGFSDIVWESVQLCWSESCSTRPTALQLLDDLSTAAALTWVPPSAYPMKVNANTASAALFGSPGVSLIDLDTRRRVRNWIEDSAKYILCCTIPLLIYLVKFLL